MNMQTTFVTFLFTTLFLIFQHIYVIHLVAFTPQMLNECRYIPLHLSNIQDCLSVCQSDEFTVFTHVRPYDTAYRLPSAKQVIVPFCIVIIYYFPISVHNFIFSFVSAQNGTGIFIDFNYVTADDYTRHNMCFCHYITANMRYPFCVLFEE